MKKRYDVEIEVNWPVFIKECICAYILGVLTYAVPVFFLFILPALAMASCSK